jgi:hypothetical protein
LSRHESEPGGELSATGEFLRVTDGGNERRGSLVMGARAVLQRASARARSVVVLWALLAKTPA